MKGKRYTTEDKIRILREGDGGKAIAEVCRERNRSEQTYHRWKRQFGMMEIHEARRLKELERENAELKKMLAESLLKNRVLEAVCEKKGKPRAPQGSGDGGGGAGMCSGRAACRFLGLSRGTYGYRSRGPSPRQEQMERRMMELSEEHPRYGYRWIAALLRREGWKVGKRYIQRLRRGAGLRVPPSKRRIVRRGVSTGLPTKAAHRGHVWTWDFIADATMRGGALRMLSILDEYTRECHVLRADRALRSEDVLEWLRKAIEEHGAPQYLRSDNGSESSGARCQKARAFCPQGSTGRCWQFIAKVVQQWLAENGIRTIYIDSGSPWQNGFVESFHGRFRDECLNREQLWTLTEARVVIEDFRHRYNQFRPHSKLGHQSPADFVKQLTPSPAPVGLRPPCAGDGQTQNHKLNQPLGLTLPVARKDESGQFSKLLTTLISIRIPSFC